MTKNSREYPLLRVNNLTVTFKSSGEQKIILDDVSFELKRNSTLGIVGESGSGKTITALSILNLIPTPPLESIKGQIFFENRDLLECNRAEWRGIRGKRIAYIFQEPMTALNPVLTIGDQITEMVRAHESISKKDAIQKAVTLLEEVGIPSPMQRLKNYPHELSGGMRQRAMIAMALSCGPDILIADEPTTALDVTIQAQVLELFKSLIQSRGMSILFVTHDLSVMAEIADHIIVLKNGKVVEYAAIQEIFKTPQHPYTRELLALI
ncbi:MAG: ABC transporter ATP-binding protein [Proteobacteria bacterium]|nr:ABC transporter ATP-binding protein [Pseudomonadota bacterium]